MGSANILVRTGVSPTGSWDPIHWALGFEGFLRQGWPEARVTVFAEGQDELWDHLYARVRDLVPLRAGIDLGEEAWARSKRAGADLVLHVCPWNATPDRLRIWKTGAKHVLRTLSPERSNATDVVFASITTDLGQETSLHGRRWLLLDPSLAVERTQRRPLRTPAQSVFIDLHDDTLGFHLRLATAWANSGLVTGVTWSTPAAWTRGESLALTATLPGSRILSERDRVPLSLIDADLVVTSSLDLAHGALALGLPVFLAARTDEVQAEALALSNQQSLVMNVESDPATLARRIGDLAQDAGRLRALSARGPELVDGQGTLRLLDLLLPGFAASKAGRTAASLPASDPALALV